MNKTGTIWTIIIIIVLIIIGVVVYKSNDNDSASSMMASSTVATTTMNGTDNDSAGTMGASGTAGANGQGGSFTTAEPESNQQMATGTGATTTPVASTAHGSVVLTATADPKLGTFLVGANGMTLYTSANDTANTSNCISTCAAVWPPYLVDASVVSLTGGTGVKGQISAITRADGTKQITYNNMPLYFYQGDKVKGDATGAGVNGFALVRE